MPRQDADDAWAAHLALKPAEEASSSRSQSAAAVPDIDAPSRTVRPPFRLFDPFSARLGTRLWLGYPLGLSASALKAKLFGGYPSVSTRRLIKGSRSYLRRHGVQSRGAAISYHKLTLTVYRKICRARKACRAWRRTGRSPNSFAIFAFFAAKIIETERPPPFHAFPVYLTITGSICIFCIN